MTLRQHAARFLFGGCCGALLLTGFLAAAVVDVLRNRKATPMKFTGTTHPKENR